MPFSPAPGRLAYVQDSFGRRAFKTWKYGGDTPAVKVNNFNSDSQLVVPGVFSTKITISGPYDEGNMPYTMGDYYILTLGWSATADLTVTGLLTNIDGDQDVEDAGRVSLTFASNGQFDISVI